MALQIGRSYKATLSQKVVNQEGSKVRAIPLAGYTDAYYVKESMGGLVDNYGRWMNPVNQYHNYIIPSMQSLAIRDSKYLPFNSPSQNRVNNGACLLYTSPSPRD